MTHDLLSSRMATETEQIGLALKFGTGNLNPYHFLHPPFFSYILFFFYVMAFLVGRLAGVFSGLEDFHIFYYTDTDFYYLVARILILAISVLIIIYSYLLAKKIFSKNTGILTVLFLVFCPEFVRSSHYATGDIPLMLLAVISFFFIIKVFLRGNLSEYILGGLFIGLAIATKYNGGMLIVPFITASLISGRKIKPEIFKILAGMFFILIGFFVGCPYAFIDYKTFTSQLVEQFRRMNSEDYLFASNKADKPGWAYIWTDVFPFTIGWPIVLLFFISVMYGIVKKNKKIYLILVFLMSYLLYTMRWTIIRPRYYLLLLPFMFMLVSDFILWINDRLGLSKKPIIGLLLLLAIIFPNLIDIVNFEKVVSDTPVNIKVKHWVEKNIERDAKIAVSDFIPLVPNKASIEEQLAEIKRKGYGEGLRLKDLMDYLYLFEKQYHVYALPLPWMENYDPEDFDFHRLIDEGVEYFVITEEFGEYLKNPAKYDRQIDFLNNVKENCGLIKHFSAKNVKLEPEYKSENIEINIYVRKDTRK
jgi:hypothetical protein